MTPHILVSAFPLSISFDTVTRYGSVVGHEDAVMPWRARAVFVRKRLSTAEAACRDWDAMLSPRLQASASTRRHEHILGRLAAAALLQTLGHPACWLAANNGCPIWPAGVMGSISHSAELVAVVATQSAGPANTLGIDLESLEQPQDTHEALRLCFDARELALLDAIPFGRLIGFAAKEALYKALHPQVGVFFGFDVAAVVAVDPAAGCLVLALLRPLGRGFAAGWQAQAHWQIFERHVVASVEVGSRCR